MDGNGRGEWRWVEVKGEFEDGEPVDGDWRMRGGWLCGIWRRCYWLVLMRLCESFHIRGLLFFESCCVKYEDCITKYFR